MKRFHVHVGVHDLQSSIRVPWALLPLSGVQPKAACCT